VSDHIEHSCIRCGSLLHYDCSAPGYVYAKSYPVTPAPPKPAPSQPSTTNAKWPTEWKGRTPAMPVSTRTERDEGGVSYEVRVGEVEARRSAYEEGEGELGVWDTYVPFGMTDDTVAGGGAFIRAAREQERIAEEWRVAIMRAQP
jgi:hypothetical protein